MYMIRCDNNLRLRINKLIAKSPSSKKVLKSNFNFAKPAKLNVHLYTKEPQLRIRGKNTNSRATQKE